MLGVSPILVLMAVLMVVAGFVAFLGRIEEFKQRKPSISLVGLNSSIRTVAIVGLHFRQILHITLPSIWSSADQQERVDPGFLDQLHSARETLTV
ncbi:hypothetical protein ASPZODRAFT_128349 [Penicilliopsis zonata CBS 506.65]|uniref:Uncharacterized protein n=1 Tax=Penicilliopsis zonata CBS 506.65 TaxID=1073090 RepID=A0A1L9SRM1_9EURO|nr:hypothetical protein ASPZODRAFT_128349 [Penicilliopsis zonata CBS 506.65]OJJ49818.1 hypothetical protein ASPZODRAFT_128349 [Penicilliopsis zonata CBS 506.65]